MALLGTFFKGAASSTDLNREFFAASVAYKLSWLFLHILGCAGRLIDSLADLLTLTITHLLGGLVALSHCLVKCLLLEGDLTGFLEVLFANLFLGRLELGDVCVVALLSVLVGALKDGVLLQGGDLFSLLNTAQPGVRVCCAATEVDTSLNSFLSSCPGQLAVQIRAVSNKVGSGDSSQNKNDKCLKWWLSEVRSNHQDESSSQNNKVPKPNN